MHAPGAQTEWAEDWKVLLGADRVITDQSELDAASTATFPTSSRVRGIVRPTSREEVQACLRIANRQRIPVYPISRGRNWGLGSRVPPGDGCVLLDLGRMDRILEFSESFAYVVVQPGVSFRQLYEFLRERGSGLTVPVTGGPADASLIGNLADGGEAVGPYGERAAFACGLEVVLPTGDCVHTGFRRFDVAETAFLDRCGVGPQLDGLFIQSNLGVLTSATLWLVPRPTCLQVFTFKIGELKGLQPAVDAFRGPVLRGTIGSHCLTFWNSHKMSARNGAQLGPGEPDDWFGCGALHTESPGQAQAERELVERAVNGVVDDLSFHDRDDEPAVRDSLFAGVPSDANVRSAYWRARTDLPLAMDPDRDRCGFIWACASVPMQGAHAVLASSIMHDVMTRFSVPPNIGMSCISGRSLHAFAAIVFDREAAGADERAMACHAALSDALAAAGYMPYRLGIQAMNSLPQPVEDYGKLIAKLKHALDPEDILAPGRYDFRKTWPTEASRR
jgi:4-cresol dehydrogenase (hydroxylating)